MKQSAKEGKLGHTAIGRFLKNYGGLVIVIIAMMTVTSLYNPVFLNSKNLLQLLINNNTTFFAGLGMTFVIISGNIDLSQGALCALATMLLAWLISMGVGSVPAILLTLAAGGLIGVINGVIVAKGKIHSFIATLGMTTILRGLAIALNRGYPAADRPPASGDRGRQWKAAWDPQRAADRGAGFRGLLVYPE